MTMFVDLARRGKIGVRLSSHHPVPGGCARTIVVELAAGRRFRLYETTHADSGLIAKRLPTSMTDEQ